MLNWNTTRCQESQGLGIRTNHKQGGPITLRGQGIKLYQNEKKTISPGLWTMILVLAAWRLLPWTGNGSHSSLRPACVGTVLNRKVFPLNAYVQALGRSKESFVINAQMKSKNAWLASQKAAFNCFHAQLTADQGLYEAQSLRRGVWKLFWGNALTNWTL